MNFISVIDYIDKLQELIFQFAMITKNSDNGNIKTTQAHT